MTTPNSPDGIPPTTTNPPTTTEPASPEQVRDWDEVRKIIAQRDAAKAREDALEARLAAIESKTITPAAPAPTSQSAADSEMAKRLAALESDRAAERSAMRRQAIESVVVSAASEAHRSQIRDALKALAYDKAVDLDASDTTAEAERAIARLRALHPGAFAPAASSNPAPSSGHDLMPPGVALHELTAEQLARLSDEDFSKLRRAARTSKLAV